MTIHIIQERLNQQRWETQIAEQQALREIVQEVILAALGRGDFFKHALFQGGTCLRIFHGLDRFSEDLDFILREPNPQFNWTDYANQIKNEMEAYGLNFSIKDKSDFRTAVKKVFLKEDSLGKVLTLQYAPKTGPVKQIRIKLEVDTNPPKGSEFEIKHITFPLSTSVAVQDLPSLFAGKMHALLCRSHIKGRDWYDFLWYANHGTPINYRFLSSALDQGGPWAGSDLVVDKGWVAEHLAKQIQDLDMKEVSRDVLNFVSEAEQDAVESWSTDHFLGRLSEWTQRQG